MKCLFLIFFITNICLSSEITDLLLKDFSIKEIKNSKSLCKFYQDNQDSQNNKIDCSRSDVSQDTQNNDINTTISSTLNIIPNISKQMDAYQLDIVLSTP